MPNFNVISQSSENMAASPRHGASLMGIELPRLLVIEWDGQTRDFIAAGAGERGFDVVACPSSREAVNLCEVNAFDAVVVDSGLYGMDCAEFLRWLRAGSASPDAHVLVLLQTGAPDEARAMLTAGADDCLARPVGAEELGTRLAVMETQRKRRGEQARNAAHLRKNHARFESIFMEAPDAILILKNREGKIIGVNRAVKAILGYDGQGLLGKYLSLVFPELFAGDGLSSFGSFLKNAASVGSVPFRCPDGTRKKLDLAMASIPWDRGFALMLTCRDVTVREAGGRLADADGKADALRRLGEGMARDVNDLVTSIGGNLELLGMQAGISREALDLLGSARSACDRVRQLAAELIGISGRAGGFVPKAVSLRALIEKTVQFRLFQKGKMRPIFRFSDEVDQVAGDEAHLRYVVEQLTDNAVQAMLPETPAGKLRIEGRQVRIGANPPHAGMRAGEYIRVTFQDDGPGIREADRERVFEPYFTTAKSGRGLGLARVRSIVRSHGGEILVESGEGVERGAVFEFYLPVAAAPAPTRPGNGVGEAAGRRAGCGAGKRILFLDDEPEIRLMVERALGSQGFEVYCAATGEEAIKAYKRSEDFGKPFDLLLLDLEIRGGLGGRETLGLLRDENPKIRAVVTTGFVEDSVLANYMDHGFCGVLAKPFRVEQLISVVSSLCGLAR